MPSTDRNDNLSSFSNYGPTSVDLGAPGSSILSTTLLNSYSSKSGTSMATPHVSGAAALIWAENPFFDLNDVKNAILDTVDPLPSLSGKVLTGGRLNVYNALYNQQQVTCDIQMSQTTYTAGDTVTAQVLKIANQGTTGVSVEMNEDGFV